MEQRMETGRVHAVGRTRMLVMTGVFAAMGCAATMVLQVPSPTGGYLNLGDTVVLLGAYLLGPGLGAVAGGMGPALADLLSGYVSYAPATLVIKALMALLAAGVYRTAGKRGWGVILGGIAAETVMVAGYWAFDGVLMAVSGGGDLWRCLAGSAVGIPGNLVQGAFGAAASTLLVGALRRNPVVREQFSHL